MKRLIILVLLFNMLTATSCRKDLPVGNAGKAVVSLKAVFGDKPFIVNQIYDYPSTGAIQFSKLQVYFSDIVLVREDGQEVELEEICIVDIAKLQTDALLAEKGWVKEYASIPIGDYAGIRFGVGVSQEFNSQLPTDFASTHPLAKKDRYSTENASFIFMNIRGTYHLDGSAIPFSLVTLKDKLFQQVQLMKPFSISADKAAIDLVFDLKKVLSREDSTMDIQSTPIISSPNSAMDWLSESLKFSFSW